MLLSQGNYSCEHRIVICAELVKLIVIIDWSFVETDNWKEGNDVIEIIIKSRKPVFAAFAIYVCYRNLRKIITRHLKFAFTASGISRVYIVIFPSRILNWLYYRCSSLTKEDRKRESAVIKIIIKVRRPVFIAFAVSCAF